MNSIIISLLVMIATALAFRPTLPIYPKVARPYQENLQDFRYSNGCLKGGKSIILIEIKSLTGKPRPLEHETMQTHRFFGEGVITSQPLSAVAISAYGFVVCPMPVRSMFGQPEGWVQGIYELAYQQARAALLPPRHERNLLASWN